MVWGVVASIVAAATVLSVAQTLLERKSGDTPKKTQGLPEPDRNFKSNPEGEYRAPLWQEIDAKKAMERAKRWMKK